MLKNVTFTDTATCDDYSCQYCTKKFYSAETRLKHEVQCPKSPQLRIHLTIANFKDAKKEKSPKHVQTATFEPITRVP
nr:unnamed protein product [Callosobruchus analis]